MFKSVVKNSAIHIAGRIIAMLIAVLTTRVLADRFGANGLGLYAIPINFMDTFAGFFDMGLGVMLIKNLSESIGRENHNKNEKEVIEKFLGTRLLGSAVGYLFALGLGFFLYADAWVRLGLILAAVSAVFVDVIQLAQAYYHTYHRMVFFSGVNIVTKIITILTLLLLVQFTQSPPLLIFSATFGNLVACLIMAVDVHKNSLVRKINFTGFKKVFSESLPLILVATFSLFYKKFPVILLSILHSSGDVGRFSVATKVTDFLDIVPFIFMSLLYPKLVNSSKNKKKVGGYLMLGFSFVAIMGFFATLILGGFAIEVLSSGKTEFLSTTPISTPFGSFVAQNSLFVLFALVFALIFSYPQTVAWFTVVSNNNQKKLIPSSFLTLALTIVVSIFLVPSYSYFGAAIAVCIGNVFDLLFTGVVFLRTKNV